MMKSKWLVIPGILATAFVATCVTNAPAQEPSVALICRGPLNTYRTDGGKAINTPFKWAKQAASKENPGFGECAWFDRTPEPSEVKTGRDNAIHGALGPFDTLPVGTFGKICVTRATMTVRGVVRGDGANAPFVLPPFS